MTTTPHAPDAATGDQAAVPDRIAPMPEDRELADRAATSATVLAGVITAGMLDDVGRPAKLPSLLWPDADPELVQAVWNRAMAVGYRAGKFAGAPRWDAAGLERLRGALRDAGWHAMAANVGGAIACAPSQHHRTPDHDPAPAAKR